MKPARVSLQMFDFARFDHGSLILDVGSGAGRELDRIRDRGCEVVGIDIHAPSLSECRERGHRVARCRAEQLPFADATFDGAVCQVVLPLVDARRTLGEIARVLRKQGVAYLSMHGQGYYFERLGSHYSLRTRVYSVRALLNSWYGLATDRRLPGFLGDTAYQSQAWMHSEAAALQLSVLQERAEGLVLGQPVFLYYVLERKG